LKDQIVVTVSNIDKTKPLTNQILYLNARPLKGVKAQPEAASGDTQQVFRFDLMADSSAEWRESLIAARGDHRLDLSVGPATDGATPLPSNVKLKLVLKSWYDPFLYVALVVLVVGLIWWGWGKGLLQDVSPVPVTGGGSATYSLARFQMLFWFVVVIGAWCFISITIDTSAVLNTQVLGLMGISAVTGLAAVAMDSNKWNTAVTQRRTLEVERDGLLLRLDGQPGQPGLRALVSGARAAAAVAAGAGGAAAGAGGAAAAPATTPVPGNLADLEKELADKEVRLGQVQAELNRSPALTAAASQGWMKDLLSDDGGVSVHRLQILVWTLAVGVYFAIYVIRNLQMPELDDKILTLMGISSGTYIGFKFPEKPAS
jgi:hypothetical protein